MSKATDKFIQDVEAKCKKHGIKTNFPNDKMVFAKGDPLGCAGYFDSENKVLAVAKKMPKEIFYGLLAHESSHLDQWIENPYLWEKCSYGYSLFFEWLEGSIRKREDLEEAVQDIIRLELDCERRAIKKIEKYNLPLDLTNYKKRANTYLFNYLFLLNSRKWIPKIYTYKYVWETAPSNFKKEYTKIPRKLNAALNRLLKENTKK